MSYLQWWKPRLTDAEAVANGARLLTETLGPGWEDRIDLGRLDLWSNEHCVLGQPYGDYRKGSKTLRVGSGRSHGFLGNGFRYDAIYYAWLDYLTPRVQRNSEPAHLAIERTLESLRRLGEDELRELGLLGSARDADESGDDSRRNRNDDDYWPHLLAAA